MPEQPTSEIAVAIAQLKEKIDSDELLTLSDFTHAASLYVLQSRSLNDSEKKTYQIALSQALGHAFRHDLINVNENMKAVQVGEIEVFGALRKCKADLVEFHEGDGIRFAAELKPVNLAVGRAIWNRFGDIRTFAVNIHIKFPFSVVAGIITVPTFEYNSRGDEKSTTHLIDRLMKRLSRAGSRETESDGNHLLEGVAVVVYDPHVGAPLSDIPDVESPLRWDNCVARLAELYDARFDDD